jgi:hypothetical protein
VQAPASEIEFHRLYEALAGDSARNQMICEDVVGAVREGRSPLLLTGASRALAAIGPKLCPAKFHT